MEKEQEDSKGAAPRDVARRRQYWNEQVQQWRGSGLTQKEYCSREGISLERFGAWKRRLDQQDRSRRGALVPIPSAIVTSALQPSSRMLSVVVGERYRVEIPDAFTPATLQSVLQVLNRL